jgi:hypothetical protein
MSFRELKGELMQALQPCLEEHGFKLQKSKEQFVRKEKGLKSYYLLDFSEHKNLHVTPTVRVRIDQVEDIFHRTSEFEKKYQADTPTLAVTLRDLTGSDSVDHTVSDRRDIPGVARQLERDFVAIAEPYCRRFSSLKQIDIALNSAPEQDSVHYLMDYLRCAHGIIVARLLGRDNFDELVQIYHRRLSRVADGFYLPVFNALVADLRAK